MKIYSGAKTIKAEPWQNGKHIDGYRVGYPGSDGKFDGDEKEGCHYISWSPADVFEAAYSEGGMEAVSDEYHTFGELYELRKMYNAMLCNEWAKWDLYEVHKSTRHSDGEMCFGGGWFVVMAQLPTGQISNHYPMKDWGLFNVLCKCVADVWDGHTSEEVLKRMQEFLTLGDRKTCHNCGAIIGEHLEMLVIQAGTANIYCCSECEVKSKS